MARVLVAEDDLAVRQFVIRALAYAGHDVASAEDGLEALDKLAKESFDLLITDIVMPGMDGIALALKLGKERPEMPILMMTGYAHERQRAHNLDALIHRVIAKPFSLKDICGAASEALAGGPVAAPSQISN